MAYRDLNCGDLVRLIDKDSPLHSRNGVVLYVDGKQARVQFGNEGDTSTCINTHVDTLLIRHEPYGYIVDGRVDQAKKAAFDARTTAQRAYSEAPSRSVYNPNQLDIEDVWGDTMSVNYFGEYLKIDVFGDQIILDATSTQELVEHLQAFLNQ